MSDLKFPFYIEMYHRQKLSKCLTGLVEGPNSSNLLLRDSPGQKSVSPRRRAEDICWSVYHCRFL